MNAEVPSWLPAWYRRAARVMHPGARLLILAYHDVGDEQRRGQVSVRHFAEHLEFLAEVADVVSLEAGLRLLIRRSNPPRPAVAITFDDGYRDNYTHACPLLVERGLPATIFVATGLIAAGQYRGRAMLSRSQIRELSDAGVSFGAHTVSHHILSSLDPGTAAAEIAVSKAQVEDITGRAAHAFAYPNGRAGDFTDANVEAVRASGFLAACTTLHGANARRENPFLLRRVGIGDFGAVELALRMSGVVDWAIAAKQRLQARVTQRARQQPAPIAA